MNNLYTIWYVDGDEAIDYYLDSLADAIITAREIEEDGYEVMIEELDENKNHIAYYNAVGERFDGDDVHKDIEALVVMLGEMQNEMRRGDAEPITEEEIDTMYDLATKIKDYLEK